MLIIHSHIQSSSELQRQTETCPERLITARSPSKVGLPVFGFETFSVVDSYWIWPLDFYPNKTQAFVSNENTSGTIQNRGSHQHSLVLRVRWNDFVLHRNASLFLFSFLSQYLSTEFKLSVRILCCHKRYLSPNCALNVNTQLEHDKHFVQTGFHQRAAWIRCVISKIGMFTIYLSEAGKAED